LSAVTIDRHLDLLALLYLVSAFVAGLAGVALLPLGVASAVLLARGQAPDVAATIATTIFLLLAVMLLAFATVAALTARGLKRRARPARTMALILAVVDLFIPPFGTALGAYAFWVLLQQGAREVFGVA
jgi:uncharacterized membrane protein